GTVKPPQVQAILRIRLAAFREEDLLPIFRQRLQDRPVKPGNVALFLITVKESEHLLSVAIARQEDAAIGGDVLQYQRSRRPQEQALFASHVKSKHCTRGAPGRSREPNLFTVRSPG